MSSIAAFLRATGGRTYEALSVALDGTVAEYLAAVLPPKGFGRATDTAAKRHLLETLRLHLVSRLPAERIDDALREFSENPVLQVGDHSDVLLDEETFFNSFFHQIAARTRHLRYLFTQQCSRTHLCHDGKNLIGPGYLHTDTDVLNVYGLSKTALCRFSAATLTDVTLRFSHVGVLQPTYSHPRLPEILEPLVGRRFERATIAVEQANAQIWNTLRMKAKKVRVSFDEGLTCDVVAAHCGDPSSLVHAALFAAREEFLRCRDAVVEAAACDAVKTTTDLFWHVRRGAVRPVRIRRRGGNAEFVDAADGAPTGILLVPEDVRSALGRRKLLPDRILGDAVLSLLPAAIALGGPTHHEGHAIVAAIFERFSPGSTHVRAGDIELGSRMIGGLVEVTPPIAKLIGNLSTRTDLDAFEEDFAGRPVRETAGAMRYFEYLYGLFRDAGVCSPR